MSCSASLFSTPLVETDFIFSSDLVPVATRKNSPAVGQYIVDVQSFESLAMKTLGNKVCIIKRLLKF